MKDTVLHQLALFVLILLFIILFFLLLSFCYATQNSFRLDLIISTIKYKEISEIYSW